MPRHTVQPPEWIESAPICVVESIEIAAEPTIVWARIADHENWPEWFTDLDSVEVLGRGSGVGGGRRVTVKRISLDEEFTAWDENERFAFAVITSRIPILSTLAESVQIESTESGCRVTYRQGVQGRRGLGWAMSLAWRPVPGQVRTALANLKTMAEADATS